jgi:hypothetical protein
MKQRTMTASWTVQLTDDINLNVVSAALAAEIDWEVLVELLQMQGWTSVQTGKKFHPPQPVDPVRDWVSENCGAHKVRNGHWLFAAEKDAIMFSLRWL